MIAAIAAIGCATACSSAARRSESESEASSSEHASEDGSLMLSEEAQRAIGLVVVDVADATLPDVHIRFGHVIARPGDEAVLVAPVTVRIVAVTALPLGTEVAED